MTRHHDTTPTVTASGTGTVTGDASASETRRIVLLVALGVVSFTGGAYLGRSYLSSPDSESDAGVRLQREAVTVASSESDSAVPSIVHFVYHPGARREDLSVWSYLSVLAARINIAPDVIRWHHRSVLPKGPWWDCAREFFKLSLHELPLNVSIHGKHFPDLHEAYKSDYLRLGVLVDEGGIYLDTDVFALRNFSPERALSSVTLFPDVCEFCMACSVIVAPARSSFIRAWLDAYRTFDPSARWAHHCNIVPFKLLVAGGPSINTPPLESLFLRAYSSGRSMFGRDDCVDWTVSSAIHGMYSERLKTNSMSHDKHKGLPPVALNNDTIDDIWAGRGSAHRVARVILRRAYRAGLLCPAAATFTRAVSSQQGGAICAADTLSAVSGPIVSSNSDFWHSAVYSDHQSQPMVISANRPAYSDVVGLLSDPSRLTSLSPPSGPRDRWQASQYVSGTAKPVPIIGPHWIEINLGRPCYVWRVFLHWHKTSWSSNISLAGRMSDDDSWTTIYSSDDSDAHHPPLLQDVHISIPSRGPWYTIRIVLQDSGPAAKVGVSLWRVRAWGSGSDRDAGDDNYVAAP